MFQQFKQALSGNIKTTTKGLKTNIETINYVQSAQCTLMKKNLQVQMK